MTSLSHIPLWCADVDPDTAVPVGSIDAIDPVTLTNVYVSTNMTVEYGEEQDGFSLWRARPLELRGHETEIRAALRLSTIEIATRDRSKGGHTAVIGYRPTSLDWFGWSRFKSVSKKKGVADRDFESLLLAASAAPLSPEAALWAALSAMKNDPFGNEDQLYARFRNFDRTDSLPDPAEYYTEEGRPSTLGSKANRAVHVPIITLGICDRFDACRELLRVSETLLVALEAAEKGIGTSHDGSALALSKTAVSLSRELMEAAIIQSLSGPGERNIAVLKQDQGARTCGTVAVLAKWLFEDSLRNLHRRTDDEERVYSAQNIAELRYIEAPAKPDDEDLTSGEILSRIQRAYESLRSGSLPITKGIWDLLAKTLSSTPDGNHGMILPARSSVEAGCIYAAALTKFLPIPDRLIEVLQKLRPDYPLLVEAVIGCLPAE